MSSVDQPTSDIGVFTRPFALSAGKRQIGQAVIGICRRNMSLNNVIQGFSYGQPVGSAASACGRVGVRIRARIENHVVPDGCFHRCRVTGQYYCGGAR